MQPTRSVKAAAREEEKVKGRTGKQWDDAETDETAQKWRKGALVSPLWLRELNVKKTYREGSKYAQLIHFTGWFQLFKILNSPSVLHVYKSYTDPCRSLNPAHI